LYEWVEKGVTTVFTDIIIMVVAFGMGLGAGFLLNRVIQRTRFTTQRHEAEDQLRQLTQSAEREAEQTIKEAKIEAKDLVFQAKAQIEKTEKEKRGELHRLERRMEQREEELERKISNLDRREEEFRKRERGVSDREISLRKQELLCEQTIREHREALERVAGLTTEEGKRQLLAEIEGEVRLEANGLTKRILDEARENADREAQQIVTNSIQRITRDYVNEATISVVALASDGMKGRIIGREGRNIRALEAATGVD